MEPQIILPVLNTEKLQTKANEYAMRGAEDAIKEFYTGYDSPYKKAINEKLKGKGVDSAIEIPDIIGILNESISKEIDTIANTAIAKTFVPIVKEFLTRAESELKFSTVLEQFIEATKYEYDTDLSMEDYKVEIEEQKESFLYIQITNSQTSYRLGLYLKSAKGVSPKVYEVFTLPTQKNKESSYYTSFSDTMKLSIDNATLEMPFCKGVLEDKFISYIAKLVIANTKITFDTDDFNEDMFPERCHC